MNVVYEALPNELQIGIPTIRDEDLIVTANGKILKKRVDKQKGLLYTLNAPKPTKGKKDLVTIKVSVKESETSSNIGPFFKDFRIKPYNKLLPILNLSTELNPASSKACICGEVSKLTALSSSLKRLVVLTSLAY